MFAKLIGTKTASGLASGFFQNIWWIKSKKRF
jgi:hypothetical protein